MRGFQSTPPVKAATASDIADYILSEISIHAAREGGDTDDYIYTMDDLISIHAAREGGDAS